MLGCLEADVFVRHLPGSAGERWRCGRQRAGEAAVEDVLEVEAERRGRWNERNWERE